MTLEFYYEESFSEASDLTPVDTFLGTGSDTSFDLVHKTGAELANTITASNTQYYQFTGGFTKASNTFTLSSAPALNAQIVAPGVVALVFSAFDQEVVEGVTDPRIKERPFFLGDRSTIHTKSWTNMPQYEGIRISIQDLVSGFGASLNIIQLACSHPTTGLALTYAATGDALITSPLEMTATTLASASVGASSLDMIGASGFIVGDYIIVNIGDPTEEIRKISSIEGETMNFFTAFEFSHAAGEDVYTMGRKFWAKVTVPVNFANNQAFNYWNLGLRRQAKEISKI